MIGGPLGTRLKIKVNANLAEPDVWWQGWSPKKKWAPFICLVGSSTKRRMTVWLVPFEVWKMTSLNNLMRE